MPSGDASAEEAQHGASATQAQHEEPTMVSMANMQQQIDEAVAKALAMERSAGFGARTTEYVGRWDGQYGLWRQYVDGTWGFVEARPDPDPWSNYQSRQDQWQGGSSSWNGSKYIDKDPPPTWDGKNPETTWRKYRRMLDQWLYNTDIPAHKHGVLLWKALTDDAKLLIDHLSDSELSDPDIGKQIRDMLEKAHKHISV